MTESTKKGEGKESVQLTEIGMRQTTQKVWREGFFFCLFWHGRVNIDKKYIENSTEVV